MKPEEIRSYEIGPESSYFADAIYFLRELTAQVAELNERLAAKQERAATGKRPKQIKSAMRMNGKKFYVDCWTMTAGEDMLSGFIPNEGQKPISELERTEFTIGTLGQNKDCKISRTQ